MKHRKEPHGEPTYRRSRQRERMLEILKASESHPTANWVYGRLRREFPDLSLGTVYRNIGILVEQGHLARIPFGSTFDRLDANTKPHYHLICEKCDSITDIAALPDDRLNGFPDKSLGFQVRRHEVEFYGVCARCSKRS